MLGRLLAVGWLVLIASVLPSGAVETIQTVDTGGLETRSAALILSGQDGGELPVAVVAVPVVAGSGAPGGVDLWVTLPGPGLAAAWPEDEEQLVEVYAYVLDEAGGVASYLSRAFRLHRQDHRPALAAGQDVTFAARLSLEPGAYSLRVLVLLRQSGRLGLRVQPLHIAKEGMAAPWQALFLAPLNGFLALGHDAGNPVPALYGPSAQVPVEWPDLNAFESLHVRVPKGQTEGSIPATVDVVVYDDGGNEVQRLAAAPRDLTAADEAAMALLELPLQPSDVAQPFDLAPGQYRLRLRPSGSEVAEGERAAWTAVRVVGRRIDAATAGSRASRAQGASSSGTDSEARRPQRRLLKAYRSALQQLADGAPRRAQQSVMELERRSKAEESASRQAELMGMQASLAASLAEDDVELLVPLMVLHDGLYRNHRRHGDFFLATHSRKLVAYLVDLYLEGSTSPSAQRVRSEIYTSQAGFLLELGSVLAARNALTAALEEDGGLVEARYLQATIAEYVGDYTEAVDVFGELAATESLDDAGRLRLAVNQRRLGKKPDDTLSLLMDLVSRQKDDWVTVVALQEAASLLWDLERHDEAQDLLRRGMERFPREPRLVIQLASLLDRSARPGEARRLLASLESLTTESRPTPRFLYSQWPLYPIDSVRRGLERRQEELLPALAVALESVDSTLRAP